MASTDPVHARRRHASEDLVLKGEAGVIRTLSGQGSGGITTNRKEPDASRRTRTDVRASHGDAKTFFPDAKPGEHMQTPALQEWASTFGGEMAPVA
jgi:hypothetical protein